MSKDDEITATEGAKNRRDVVVREAAFDFTQWNWGYRTNVDEISENAARVVLDVLVRDAAIEITVAEGVTQLEFGTFDYEFRLHFPLLSAVDYWVETHVDRHGMIGGDRESMEEAGVILADLEEACRRVRKAMGT